MMEYKVTIQKKKKWYSLKNNNKEEIVMVVGEDQYWALQNAIREYPNYNILSIN